MQKTSLLILWLKHLDLTVPVVSGKADIASATIVIYVFKEVIMEIKASSGSPRTRYDR